MIGTLFPLLVPAGYVPALLILADPVTGKFVPIQLTAEVSKSNLAQAARKAADALWLEDQMEGL